MEGLQIPYSMVPIFLVLHHSQQSMPFGYIGRWKMKQFTLPLIKKAQRPTVRLERFFRLRAMLDTGAVLPVWIESEELLKVSAAFPWRKICHLVASVA